MKPVRGAGFIVLALLCLPLSGVRAHEHWVDVDDFYPVPGSTGKVFVCSGHDFPESSIVIKDRVLHASCITGPGGEKAGFETVGEEKSRSAEVFFNTNGVHIIGFELKQPQMKEPLHWAKAIVVAGEGDDENLYSTGEGLEIVPASRISTLAKGDTVLLAVKYNGVEVKTRLSILPEHGRAISLSTTEDRPASLVLSHTGRCLVTAAYKGKSCSLTFVVGQTGGGK